MRSDEVVTEDLVSLSFLLRFPSTVATGSIVGQCVRREWHTDLPALRTATALLARYLDSTRADLCLAGIAAIGDVGKSGAVPLDDGDAEKIGV